MITHLFSGSYSDKYGTYAYIENDELVVGEGESNHILNSPGLSYRGTGVNFVRSKEFDELCKYNYELASSIHNYFRFSRVEQEEPMDNKLCEIKVTRADSLKELVYHLTANGYKVQTAVIWKEFPNTGIDCWQIAIFDKET